MQYINVLKKLVPYAQRYRYLILLSLIITFIGAALAQVTPLIMRFLVDQVTVLVESREPVSSAWSILIFVFLILLGKEIFLLATNFGTRYLGEFLKAKIAADLSNEVYSYLLTLDMAYFDEPDNDVGRLTKRVDRGVEGLSKTVKNLFTDILPLLINAVTALTVMFSVNVWVGITSSLIVPVYLTLSFKQAQRQKGVRHSIQDIHEDRTQAMFGVLSAIKLVQSFTQENFETHRHQAINEELTKKEIGHHLINHFFDAWKLFFEQIGAILVIFVTSVLVLNGSMSVGAIMLHLLLYNNITAPIRHLHRIYDESMEAIVYAQGFFSILQAKSRLSLQSGLPAQATSIKIEGKIQLRNVSFGYVPGQRVINGVNLTIPSHKTIALVGLSGAGKTTVANLIGRFYDPDEGQVLLDDIDLREYNLQFVRQNMGFVLQESHIFRGTIADNIRYGKQSASDEDVVAAAKRAALHDYISLLPNGYQSPAMNLSGGQKQRIAIARVFLKDPPLLVLDEPTASLDAITASQIQDSLTALRLRRTVLVISHNLASIVDADLIYVIKEGQVTGEGIHQTLYHANTHYREIIDANIENTKMERILAVRDKPQT